MPHMQKEIEVKAKVDNFDAVKAKLLELGCVFSDPVRQEDEVFVNFEGDYTELRLGTNFLRIRKENKAGKERILFTLKQPQSNELDCIEKEVEISDVEQFKGALILMGYHSAISVRKNRIKTKYNDTEICLDEVDELGSFIEVEKVTEGDGDNVQEELFNFLETLGIRREERVIHGYDTLLYWHINKK